MGAVLFAISAYLTKLTNCCIFLIITASIVFELVTFIISYTF